MLGRYERELARLCDFAERQGVFTATGLTRELLIQYQADWEDLYPSGNSLRAIDNDAQALQSRTEAAAQAETTYNIAARRYAAGGISQLSLLDAQRQYLQTTLDQTTSVANRYTDSASLFQALGGGWWNETPAGAPAPTSPPKSR